MISIINQNHFNRKNQRLIKNYLTILELTSVQWLRGDKLHYHYYKRRTQMFTPIEIMALQSNDLTKQETIVKIIDGYNALPSKQQQQLKSVFQSFIQGE